MDESDFDNFKILITDGPSYCKKAAKNLKNLLPNLKHITCLAHGVHNLSTTII